MHTRSYAKAVSGQVWNRWKHTVRGTKKRMTWLRFFQVLEHISAVQSFLTAAIKCLKKNGLLVLAVPNNEPYLFGFNKYDWLNLPPHHMGWWNAASLQKLSGFFPIKTERIRACPFRDYNNYLNAQEVNTAILNPGRLRWLKATRPVRKQWIQLNRNNIPAFLLWPFTKKHNP
jgi:hypothetical protein